AEGFTDGEVVEVLLPAFCGALEDPHIAAGDEVQPLRLVALGVDQGAPIVRACDHPSADRGKNSRRERREIWMPAEDRERICHETHPPPAGAVYHARRRCDRHYGNERIE